VSVHVHPGHRNTLPEFTQRCLWKKFGVESTLELSDEQRDYCEEYYDTMVEPFVNSSRTTKLLESARITWRRIFGYLKHLEKISVGCCARVYMPQPTNTGRFILQHGKHVINDVKPRLREDATVNAAWASAIIIRTAPSSVRALELSVANVYPHATSSSTNRLLSSSHRNINKLNGSTNITRLTLNIRGVAGTHGLRDMRNSTGSAGCVYLWKKMLNDMRHLQHLELKDAMSKSNKLKSPEIQDSDPKACILDWLLPELILDQLLMLRLCDFDLAKATMEQTLLGQWPKLEKLIFDHVGIMSRESLEESGSDQSDTEHMSGHSWVNIWHILTAKRPGLCIGLNRVSSSDDNAKSFRFKPQYEEELRERTGLISDVKAVSSEVAPAASELRQS
jgi:hypothetical protein